MCNREIWPQLGVNAACHTAVQTCHHQNKKSLTCSCLSSFQLQSRVSPCGGGLFSLHWKRRNKWTQIKTYTTPAVLKDDIFGGCVVTWRSGSITKNKHEQKKKNNTKVCLLSYLHPIIVIKVKHHHCMPLRRKSKHSGSYHILITQETACCERTLSGVQMTPFKCFLKSDL